VTYTRQKTSAPQAQASNQWATRIPARSQGIADAGEREVAGDVVPAESAKRHWSISETSMAAPKQRNSPGPVAGASAVAPPIVHQVLSSPGSPLDSSTRDFFEPKLGEDLGNVRLHTGERAAQSAQALSASAYTIGSDVVFGPGATPEQKPLLAHELAHAVQQSHAPGSALNSDGSVLEAEAERTAAAISGGSGVARINTASEPRISRQAAAPAPSPVPPAFLTPQDITKLQAFGNAEYQASLDTLDKMLTITGDVTREGLPRQYVSTRQASGELRTFLDFIRNPDIQALKVVPSASGGRSPDFYYQRVGGAEGRVEVVNITAASSTARAQLGPDGARRRPREDGSVVPTVEDIDTVAKLREAIRVKIKAGSQLSAQNPNTQIQGRQMQTGGEVRVSTSHVELSRSQIDGVIRDLQTDLANAAADKVVVDTIAAADPRAGRKLFEYVRDQQGIFSFSNLRTSFAQAGTAPATPSQPAPTSDPVPQAASGSGPGKVPAIPKPAAGGAGDVTPGAGATATEIKPPAPKALDAPPAILKEAPAPEVAPGVMKGGKLGMGAVKFFGPMILDMLNRYQMAEEERKGALAKIEKLLKSPDVQRRAEELIDHERLDVARKRLRGKESYLSISLHGSFTNDVLNDLHVSRIQITDTDISAFSSVVMSHEPITQSEDKEWFIDTSVPVPAIELTKVERIQLNVELLGERADAEKDPDAATSLRDQRQALEQDLAQAKKEEAAEKQAEVRRAAVIADKKKRAQQQGEIADRLNALNKQSPAGDSATPPAAATPQQLMPSPPEPGLQLLPVPGGGVDPIAQAAAVVQQAIAWEQRLENRAVALQNRIGSANSPSPEESQAYIREELAWVNAMKYTMNVLNEKGREEAVNKIGELLDRKGPMLHQVSIYLGGE
jgi:hypothetical protein